MAKFIEVPAIASGTEFSQVLINVDNILFITPDPFHDDNKCEIIFSNDKLLVNESMANVEKKLK